MINHNIEPMALTIREFCAAYKIGKSKFYELAKEGAGPKTCKIGRKTLIAKQEADTWFASLQNPH